MRETFVEKIAWRRHGICTCFMGALRAADDAIRLSGRDPASGLEVTLSIPASVLESVRVSESGDELLAGERCVVLELVESEAIFLREIGVGPLHIHVLARRLGALTQTQHLLAQGG